MGFYDKTRRPPSLNELPVWRRSLFLFLLGLSLLITVKGVDKGLTVYSSAPDHPIPEKGQIYSVDVEHGNIRYLSASEKESYDLWGGRAGSWAGAGVVGAFLLWITSPKKKNIQSI
jgi:hypothetical protein